MSRSNPTVRNPNPCTRWFEWNGEKGSVRFYDKEKQANIDVGSKFTFIWLDTLATITGWHKKSKSSIFSNEIRDSRDEPFVVRAFKMKEGTIAEGLYKGIKEKIAYSGGHFTANLYIAYKEGEILRLASIQFKGVTLHAWVDFEKANRDALTKKAVMIDGFTEGVSGDVTFRLPVFKLKDISEDTNRAAIALDKEIQAYLESYFRRTRIEQSEPEPGNEQQEPGYVHPAERMEPELQPEPEDDIPF